MPRSRAVRTAVSARSARQAARWIGAQPHFSGQRTVPLTVTLDGDAWEKARSDDGANRMTKPLVDTEARIHLSVTAISG